MKFWLRLALAASVWLACNPAYAGFASSDVYLPSIGRVAGSNGAQFSTTVWITNLSSSQPVSFGFSYLASGQANPNPATFSDTLAPGETKMYEDVLLNRFGLTTALGAGHIVASNGDVFVSARIYDLAPGQDIGQSKGLFFAGVPALFALRPGESSTLQGVNQGGAENFRYNFAMVETAGNPATFEVTALDALGNVLGTKNYPLGGFEHFQTNVADVVPNISTTNARLVGTVLVPVDSTLASASPSGSVIFAGAQVANESQDASGFEMLFSGSLESGATGPTGPTGPAGPRGPRDSRESGDRRELRASRGFGVIPGRQDPPDPSGSTGRERTPRSTTAIATRSSTTDPATSARACRAVRLPTATPRPTRQTGTSSRSRA